MKQLEQEKDILLQGLELVDRARDWYQKQIQAVQDKQKYIGKGSSPNVRTQGFGHAERKQKSTLGNFAGRIHSTKILKRSPRAVRSKLQMVNILIIFLLAGYIIGSEPGTNELPNDKNI